MHYKFNKNFANKKKDEVVSLHSSLATNLLRKKIITRVTPDEEIKINQEKEDAKVLLRKERADRIAKAKKEAEEAELEEAIKKEEAEKDTEGSDKKGLLGKIINKIT